MPLLITKKAFLILIGIFWMPWLCLLATTLDSPLKSSGDVVFYLDTASFRARGGQTYQEFYYQLPLSLLTFSQNPSGYQDTLAVAITIFDTLGQSRIHDDWQAPFQVQNQQELAGQFWPDQFELVMQAGLYRLVMEIKELSSQKKGAAELWFTARDFSAASLQLSDIQFASQISVDSSQQKMTKNNLKVIPNPNRIFGKTLPLLYFYLEIYNLTYQQNDAHYRVDYAIFDQNDGLVKQFPAATKLKKGPICLEASALPLAGLKEGNHFFKVTITDLTTGVSQARRQQFWHKIYKSEMAIEVPENNVSRYLNTMTETGLDLHFTILKYFMAPTQADIYKSLSPQAQRAYLINFWQILDPVPTSPENEFLDEFQQRLQHANRYYTSGFKDGWRTDRGRIIMKFGIPDEITREEAPGSTRPFQDWFYNTKGGHHFIFLDEDGFGHYRLIFSTEETEFTDPNWRLLLSR
jgi:GWxTD domain-containing protein